MTAVVDGRAGLKLMLSRLLIWRVGIGYWFFAILFLVPAILLSSLANPLLNDDPISFSDMKPAFDILPMFVSLFIIAGLGQELGWTGFLIPRLQTRFSALISCIICAILSVVFGIFRSSFIRCFSPKHFQIFSTLAGLFRRDFWWP